MMSHQAQLDLRVVGHEEHAPSAGDRAAADRLAPGCADRDVLEVGLAQGEPPGGGARLVEAGVDPSRLPLHPGREHVDVRVLQLLQLTVVENQLGHLVTHGCELLQHIGVGRRPGLGLLEDLQLLLFEQDGGELAGRVEVERLAGHLPDPELEPRQVLGQLARELAEERRVDGDPVPFHLGDHRHERHLDRLEQLLHPGLGQHRLEETVQGQHRRAVGAAVIGGGRIATSAKGISAFPFPATSL